MSQSGTANARYNRAIGPIHHLQQGADENQEWTSAALPNLSIKLPDIYIAPSTPWLPTIEMRVQNSIGNPATNSPDLTYIGPAVSYAAVNFFRCTSDLLPGEPYLYSSRSGELVAEFNTSNGSLTTIISPSFTILFATNGENVQEITLREGSNRVREEVGSVKAFLESDPNG